MGYPAKKIERSANSLVVRARKILEKRNSFLLVFDVKDSRKYYPNGTEELLMRLDEFCSRVTRKYRANIVRGEVNTRSYFKSFCRIIGDGGGGYFNKAEVVEEIMELARKELSSVEFWWNVAEDIWDEENSRIIA